MTRTVAIISALEEEAAHIANACTNVREEHRASLAVLHGELTTDAGDRCTSSSPSAAWDS